MTQLKDEQFTSLMQPRFGYIIFNTQKSAHQATQCGKLEITRQMIKEWLNRDDNNGGNSLN